MSSHYSRIQPLPPDVVAKIKSSTSITHLNGVIVELVKNALDANADTVAVTVDFQRGGCVVEDNGDGIPPPEFQSSGGLGKAHHTSKFHSEKDVYGRRGMFLASLASLSLLTITSHHCNHQSANTIIFHHSTPVARLIPAQHHQEIKYGHGTRVTVNDLFGNMPVRVKSRALAFQKQDELEREWDDLRQLLVALMLANDSLEKLVLSDASRSRKITIHPRNKSSRIDGELNLRRISSILSQAGLINLQGSSSWNDVSARVPDFSIHAAVCLAPSPTKKIQFISLGKEVLFSQNNTNIVYNEINRLFASSDFGATGPLPQILTGAQADAKVMAKAVNRWPMFYVRIETSAPQILHGDGQEIAPESDKSIQRIMDVLSAMINEFLKQHSLRPRAGKRKRQASTMSRGSSNGDARATKKPETSARQDTLRGQSMEETLDSRLRLPSFQRSLPMNFKQDLGNWSRIKGAKEPSLNDLTGIKLTANRLPIANNDDTRPLTEGFRMVPTQELNSAVGDVETTDVPQLGDTNTIGSENEATDCMIPWKDPYTGKSCLVNSRTGQSMYFQSPADIVRAGKRPQSTGSIRTRREPSSIRRSETPSTNRAPSLWIDNLLKRWDNPTFSRPEKPIDALDMEASLGNDLDNLRFKPHGCSGDTCGMANFGLANFRGKLHRQDLEMSEVVAQVDQKFILAKLRVPANADTNNPGSILTLIDQHAADERCRVERLYEEFFEFTEGEWTVQTVRVDPIIFEASQTEIPLLQRELAFFASWGVQYDIEQRTGSRTTLVSVYTLPTLIAERCRMEPHLVTDIIRSEIWKREENGEGYWRSRQEDSFLAQPDIGTRVSWVERLGGCPRGIVDLLNSRACRTAIMFNDELSLKECQNLVTRLARCVFPFQCAHGRPSMVPILDMQSIDRVDYPVSEYQTDVCFDEAFRRRYP